MLLSKINIIMKYLDGDSKSKIKSIFHLKKNAEKKEKDSSEEEND